MWLALLDDVPFFVGQQLEEAEKEKDIFSSDVFVKVCEGWGIGWDCLLAFFYIVLLSFSYKRLQKRMRESIYNVLVIVLGTMHNGRHLNHRTASLRGHYHQSTSFPAASSESPCCLSVELLAVVVC